MHDVYKKQLALTGNTQRLSRVYLLCQENGVGHDTDVWLMQTGHVTLY